MNKQQFIDALSEKRNISKVEATSILGDFKSIIKEQLISNSEVSLGQDFGTFKPTTREGKVPGTNKSYKTNLVKFSISAPFKRELQ